MSSEVSLDSMDFDKYGNLSSCEGHIVYAGYCEKNFLLNNCFSVSDKKAAVQTTRFETDGKMQRAYSENMKSVMSKVSGEVGITYQWGGQDGGGVSAHASAKGSDDKGNTAEVKVEVNKDGSGSTTVNVSHEEEN